MSILPRPGQLPYNFDEAQRQIQRTSQDLVSAQARQLSNNILQRLDNARTQNNEQRIEQQNDIPFIIKTINDTIQNDEDRKRLIRQTQVLSDALEDNSSTLRKYTREITHSLMNKGIGRNGQFTPIQNVLTKAKDSVMSDLMPIFRLPLEGLGNFFKNRSDRNDRVREEMLRQNNEGGGGGQSNPPAVTGNNSSSSNFQDISGGSSGGGNQNIFNGPNYNIFNGPNYNVFNGGFFGFPPSGPTAPRSPVDAIEGDLRLLEYTPEDDTPPRNSPDIPPTLNAGAYAVPEGDIRRRLDDTPYNPDIPPRIGGAYADINFIRIKPNEELYGGSPSPILPPDDSGFKDFNTLEDEENYRRDSINEQRKTTEAIEKLSAILSGKKGGGGGNPSPDGGGGGGISSLLDMGKDYLLTKLGIKKAKQVIGGLKDKAGDFLKSKVGQAGDFLKSNANKAGNVVKELGSKSASVVKEQAPKLGRFLVDKGSSLARSGTNWVAANPVLATYGGLAAGAALATKHANEELAKTEHGRQILEAGDGVLDTSDNFDFEDAGFDYVNIEEKGLDAFGNVKNEEKFLETSKAEEAYAKDDEERKKKDELFQKKYQHIHNWREEGKDEALAREVWARGNYESEYKTDEALLGTSGAGYIREKNRDRQFERAYHDAEMLRDLGLYYDDNETVRQMMEAGETTKAFTSKDGTSKLYYTIDTLEDGQKVLRKSVDINRSGSNGSYMKKGTIESRKFKTLDDLKDKYVPEKSKFEDVSEQHYPTMMSFLEGVENPDIHKAIDVYEKHMPQVEEALVTEDKDLKTSYLEKIKKKFLIDYEKAIKEPTKEDVTPKSSIPVLPETERITDIDHNYSQSPFEDVSVTKESNVPVISSKQMKDGEIVQNNELSNSNVSKTEAITQQPSSKSTEAYTAQPTRTAVVAQEQQSSSANKKKEEQAPTIINNNYNTTNNNVTQSSPQQRSPQIIVNPSPSYLGQPTAR